MGTCVNCKYAGRPTYKSPCSECQGYNKYEAVEIRTNGDRFRALSDEDLAVTILCIRHGERPWCDERCGTTGSICENCITKWLKEPYEEGKHNEQIYHKSGYSGLHG